MAPPTTRLCHEHGNPTGLCQEHGCPGTVCHTLHVWQEQLRHGMRRPEGGPREMGIDPGEGTSRSVDQTTNAKQPHPCANPSEPPINAASNVGHGFVRVNNKDVGSWSYTGIEDVKALAPVMAHAQPEALEAHLNCIRKMAQEEKARRVYYEDLCYKVANLLDGTQQWDGATVVGTSDDPNGELLARVRMLMEDRQSWYNAFKLAVEKRLALQQKYDEALMELHNLKNKPHPTYCAYCGHEIHTADPDEAVKQITDHIASCIKHPLHQLLVELTEARNAIKHLQRDNSALEEKAHHQYATIQRLKLSDPSKLAVECGLKELPIAGKFGGKGQ